jgi:hypothetical protein
MANVESIVDKEAQYFADLRSGKKIQSDKSFIEYPPHNRKDLKVTDSNLRQSIENAIKMAVDNGMPVALTHRKNGIMVTGESNVERTLEAHLLKLKNQGVIHQIPDRPNGAGYHANITSEITTQRTR